ncbi:MAG: ABC transporter ATP-binding protein [Bacillota bacterium]
MGEALLEVRDLKTYFYTEDGVVPAVDGVSFSVGKGETIGIVGESGCGKSVTSLSIMRLIPNPPGKIIEGDIIFEGENILEKSEAEMRHIRGNEISMIFQEPMTSLNPVFTIGDQVMEAIMLHQKVGKREARKKTIEMLKLVGIPSAERRVDEYPHQMSGGMRQRVMIAMALSCNPRLLIADEPTTALDVTIQAQILDLMIKLKQDLGTAIMLITHDLGVIAETVNNVVVMYAGKIVESADVVSIFKRPEHPYTLGLLGSIPKVNEDRERLQVIEGVVPNPFNMPGGCRFHPRCSFVRDICKEEEPGLVDVEDGHQVRCWKFLDYSRH